LKHKLNNKEYTLLNIRNKPETELIDIAPTDSIHIIGNNNLSIEIIQSDSTSIEKDKGSDAYVYEKDGLLTVRYAKDDMNSQHPGVVTIKTPTIKAISFEGELVEVNTGNKNKTKVTRYYKPY